MSLGNVRHPLTSFALLCAATWALTACNGGEGEPLPVNMIDLTGDAGTRGCIQLPFPSDQPDLDPLHPPRFLLTTSSAQNSTSGQAVVNPGDPVEAEITVDGETRQVLVELKDVWNETPALVSEEFDTPGNQTLDVILFSRLEERPSRFYMRITLCGFDCDERQVIYDKGADINENYMRTVIEDGEVVRVDNTCIDFGANPGVGSRTILIQ